MCNNNNNSNSSSLFGLSHACHAPSESPQNGENSNNSAGNTGNNNTSQRSLFGSLKRDRSQRSSTTLSGSQKSLSGFLNDARTAAVATCNAVFSELSHSPSNNKNGGADDAANLAVGLKRQSSSSEMTMTASASHSSLASDASVHSSVFRQHQMESKPTTEVMKEMHRSSDSVFLSTDTTRRGSITAPPPRKGRRRMSGEEEERIGLGGAGMPKVMSSPALTHLDTHIMGSEGGSVPIDDAVGAAATECGGMSLSDGEDVILDFLKKHSVPMPSTTPMNSPSNSYVKRVQSMPALVVHGDAMSEDEVVVDMSTITSSETEKSAGSDNASSDLPIPPDTNPEEYLKTIMASMGYPSEPVDTLSVANFFHEHTPEQIAAYDNETCGAARSDDLEGLRNLWRAGKILQCSNRFGESLIHIACRRGSYPVISFLLNEAGVSIRVRDDCGRTPLHDACWASHPNFEVIRMLIEREPDFLMLCDKRGHTPLAYVRREKWGDWCRFLNENRTLLTPKGNILTKDMDS